MDPVPLREAHAAYDRLTRHGTISTTPDDDEYYDIFAVDPLPEWQDGRAPLIRRLHPHDAAAIEAHFLGLDAGDRRLRFFREATDAEMRDYVRRIDWHRSRLLGAIVADRVVGIAEALFDRTDSPGNAEIAVSVDLGVRRRGLGRYLVRRAVAYAEILGARQTSLSFLRENRPIQRIVRGLGGSVDMEDLVGVIRFGDVTIAPSHADQRLAA
jgi:GNAT superfamily N-acetyltransferase